MTYQLVLEAAERLGFGIAAFGLCAWIMMQVVNGVSTTLSKLSISFTQFAVQVSEVHKASTLQQQNLMDQHERISATLDRISTKLGAI